jgi:DNA-binding beta-propeller fold protein YncE
MLNIADPKTHKVTAQVGPFAAPIRPFTVNGSNTLVFVNVNSLLGFEVGDIKTGKKLYRVEVQGFESGPVKRHGCPSHGIALSPDERELWVADGKNNRIHIFDATVMPPKQGQNIEVRDLPGWITFSIDGRTVWSSSGEVIDARTKKITALLKDEAGHEFQSEKLLEVVTDGNKVTKVGDQFGVGAKR